MFATAVGTVGDEVRRRRAGHAVRRINGGRPCDLRVHLTLDDHLISSVSPDLHPAVRSGYVSMNSQAWHEISVPKFVNQYFILDRPDLAMFQRGQEQTVEHLVLAFDDCLSDPIDASRAPRRLLDLVNTATNAYQTVAREHPSGLAGTSLMPSWHGWAGVAGSSTSSVASPTPRPSPSVRD